MDVRLILIIIYLIMKKINPCGLDNKNITSIQEIKKEIKVVNEKRNFTNI